MEFHPVASIFPMMSNEEYADLVESIRASGLREPIWTYQSQIVDGRNRYKACVELGIEPTFREYTDSEERLVQFVVDLNLKRRHLTSSQKAVVALDVLGYLENRAKERQIELAGTRPNTQPDLTQKVEQGTDRNENTAAAQAAEIVGTNRQYVSDAKKIVAKAPDLAEQVKQGDLTIPEAKRELKKRERFTARAAEPKVENSNILTGNMRDLGKQIADNSVDLIFTDPPYGNEHIDDYKFLAELAARVLKPGASLLCYCGQSVLPRVLSEMTPIIDYHWIIALEHSGPGQRFPGKWVFINWKPILWFTKGPRRDTEFVADLIKGDHDKDHHEWGQGVSEARYYIEHLTAPSELVLDPFCGGGTTCLAARQLGRNYLAFEIDPVTAETAARRLNV